MDVHIITEKVAMANWLCPLSKTFARSTTGHCRGSACALWRWRKLLVSEPGWKAAVMTLQDEINPDTGKKFGQNAALKIVNANPREFNLPEKPYVGWCGLGGKPDA